MTDGNGRCTNQADKKAVPCPDVMKDPTWKNCVGGIIHESSATSSCSCVLSDPPQMKSVVCPKGG